jgi:hypothetical protein
VKETEFYDNASLAKSSEASAIVPAAPGWFVVSAHVDQDGVPTGLEEEPVLAWMVEAKTDALPNRLRRCSSSAWPITTRVDDFCPPSSTPGKG